jgi:hypothetical protein
MALPHPNFDREVATPVKEPAVVHEFNILSDRIEHLTQHLEALRNRLSPVLLDAKPEQTEEKAVRVTPTAPLASQLRDAAEQVSCLRALVADLQDRLEI